MVETVLSRDKNWVRWKIESCPSIEKPAISPEEHIAAKAAARKATTNKRLRAKPLGSLDLSFLTEADGATGMEKLKEPSRYTLPTLASFKDKIALDDLEIQMPTSQETKEAAINSKASKSWRALRIASKTKLATFDKIQENLGNLDVIFQDDQPELDAAKEEGQDSMDVEDMSFPADRRPLVISGPSGVGKRSLVKMLLDKHPKVFAKQVSHTTRAPTEGEIDGVDYHFVDTNKFNIIRDGDQFLEYGTDDGHDCGTTRKAVESVIANGKIPVMDMDCQVRCSFPGQITLIFLRRHWTSSGIFHHAEICSVFNSLYNLSLRDSSIEC
jgi:THO complex subunit 1